MGNAAYSRSQLKHEFADDVSNGVEWFIALTYLLGSIIVFLICAIHLYRMCGRGDLFPKKEAQQINPYYATVQWYSLFSLLFYAVYQFGIYLAFSREEFCFNDVILGMNGYYLAETLFYAVGILRLKLMYLDTKFEVGTNKTIILVGLTHFTYFILTNMVWFNLMDVQWIESTDPTYPRYCVGILPAVSIFFIVTEVAFLIGVMGSFWYKLRGIMQFKGAGSGLEIFKSYALRVTILYTTASISTIVGMFIFLLSAIGAQNKILQTLASFVSVMMNVTALCLMTSYYPNVYGYLCCLCIKCCDPKRQSKQYSGVAGDDQRKYAMINVNQFRNGITALYASPSDDASPKEATEAVNLTQKADDDVATPDANKTD